MHLMLASAKPPGLACIPEGSEKRGAVLCLRTHTSALGGFMHKSMISTARGTVRDEHNKGVGSKMKVMGL